MQNRIPEPTRLQSEDNCIEILSVGEKKTQLKTQETEDKFLP